MNSKILELWLIAWWGPIVLFKSRTYQNVSRTVRKSTTVFFIPHYFSNNIKSMISKMSVVLVIHLNCSFIKTHSGRNCPTFNQLYSYL